MQDLYRQALNDFQSGQLEKSLTLCEQLRDQIGERLSGLQPQEWQLYQRLMNLQQQTMLLAVSCQHDLGQNEDAIANVRKLLGINPNDPEIHCKLAYYLLYAGEFEAGWEEFEWRHRMPSRKIGILDSKQRWHGEDLSDKSILVLCQQGFGDCIQFARYLPMLRERARRLVFHCRRPLAPLFEGAPYIDELMVEGIHLQTDIDVYTNICSLGNYFSAGPANVPPPMTIQKPSDERYRHWQSRLAATGFHVGIAWSGSSMSESNTSRPGGLGDFLRLLEVPDVHLYTLQLHEPMQGMPENFHQLGTKINDFADTAAIVQQLDLVISVDTALAHLALTMRRETWVVLPAVTDWRWVSYAMDGSYDRSTDSSRGCIWYPEARMFKQKTRLDRRETMNEVVQALHERLAP